MRMLVNLALKVRGTLNKVGDYGYVSTRTVGEYIPKVIHQTYHSKNLPNEIADNIRAIKAMNPDWEHRLYDDADIEHYIHTHFPELLNLYKKINPTYGAAKADFFRYLLMYNEGGVYLDIKSGLSKPLNRLIHKDDCYFLAHWQNEPGQSHPRMGLHACIANPFGEFQQWHIIAVKGHPFLKAVIENVCNNICHYSPFIHDTGGWSIVNLTGPIAYTQAITPLLTTYPHQLARDNSQLGLIYSIYESKGVALGHHKILKKHYTHSNESLVLLPLASRIVFNAVNPLIKLLKAVLMKLR